MHLLITGGTGFIGKPLTQQLRKEGHKITLLSRTPGAGGVEWTAGHGAPDLSGIAPIDGVVHLAGEGIADKAWSPERRREILDSRTLGAREISQALQKLPTKPEIFLSASATGFYGDRGDTPLDETSPPGSGFLSEVTQAWEAATAEAPARRVVSLRFGMVLGSQGGALKELLRVFRTGLGGPAGSGKQWVSWIHLEDLIHLISFALRSHEVRGVLNATSPHPVRNEELAQTLGHLLHRPAFLRAPAWALRAMLGPRADLVLQSQKVYPKRATELGFTFRFPELPVALTQILKLE
ncbi:TIGR01777 family oxidoreductase [bacterium]|nr:TIGR01777 family oxidoreductase [bacterium]